METILLNDISYKYYTYSTEKEFEQVIISKAKYIFGTKSIYIDIKKRIGDSIITIPDGYLIDFSFEHQPRLYIIENELSSHDPYKHIGSQLLKFAISYKASGRKIKAFLLQHLMKDEDSLMLIENSLAVTDYRNIDDLLESIIFEKPVAAIVIIDKLTSELENVLGQLTMNTDVIEFQAFRNESDFIYKFQPFNSEIRDISESKTNTLKPEELNTVVVAAREEGFENEFIGNKRWFAIRIHVSMLDKLKYIAAYQVSPISAITHYAEIASIEKWNDTNKYIIYFKNSYIPLEPIGLDKTKKGLAPQAPRYTSIERLLAAKKLSDVF